jgi:hypothetical protein
MWLELVTLLINVNLIDAEDSWEWKLGKNSVFSVKSMYNDLMIAEQVPVASPIWKLKIPLKIKVFMWYLTKGVTLTKYIFLQRNWKGDNSCYFFSSEEII